MSVLEPIRSRRSGTAGLARGNEWSWFNHARYDASNRRVWKLNANGEAYYLYDLSGENLGTFTPQMAVDPTGLYLQQVPWQERAYFFGKKLFVTEDNVGSALASSPSPRSFYPYGEPKSGTAATEQFAFATYWEDSETGLDYAMNRYYSSTLGRFLSPDPYAGSMDVRTPQSFNRYGYAAYDPVGSNDPEGLEPDYQPCVINGISYPFCPWGGSGVQLTGWGLARQIIALFQVIASQVLSGIPDDSDCQKDVNALSTEASTTPGARAINDYTLIEQIVNMDVENGATATAPASTLNDPDIDKVPNVANGPISNLFNNPNEHAVSVLGGDTVYFNPSYILHMYSASAGAGMVTHEALHNLGLNDGQIEDALGISGTANCKVGSVCITQKLDKDCFSTAMMKLTGGGM